MKRPLSKVRPIGPFSQLGSQRIMGDGKRTSIVEINDEIVVRIDALGKERARKEVEKWASSNFDEGIGKIVDSEVIEESGIVTKGESGVYQFTIKE